MLPSADELRHHVLSQADASALAQLEEDANSEDERLFASYRAKKLAEVRADEARRARAGNDVGGDGVAIREISKGDFVREVSEASERNVEGDGDVEGEDKADDVEDDRFGEEQGRRTTKGKGKAGMGVVCFLYKDSWVASLCSCLPTSSSCSSDATGPTATPASPSANTSTPSSCASRHTRPSQNTSRSAQTSASRAIQTATSRRCCCTARETASGASRRGAAAQ